MKASFAAFIALLTILSLAFLQQGEAVSCNLVDADLAPCLAYLTGHDADPSATCCEGVKSVKGMAKTTEDKKSTCNCVKEAAARVTDLKDDAAQSLAGKCGVQLDIPVSRDVDCNKIH